MSGFYVSLIFIGILLAIISLVLILIDKKNVFIFRKTFDDKKQELVEIINDAEQMIDELNRFSDYIVSQIDVKNEELNTNIKGAEKKISALEEKATAIVNSTNAANKKIVKYDCDDAFIADEKRGASENIEVKVESDTGFELPARAFNSSETAAAAYGRNEARPSKTMNKRRDKVIPFTNRYSEVLRLSNEGMEDLDIAKSLNMGKGEVELIIGLRR